MRRCMNNLYYNKKDKISKIAENYKIYLLRGIIINTSKHENVFWA